MKNLKVVQKFLIQNGGFSLVETMIAAALAAGVALTVAKIGQESSRVSKTMETNLEINQAMNDIAYILSDKESCNATVNVGTTPPVNSDVADIKSVKNGVTTTKYVKNQKYGNGAFSIVDMDTVDAGGGNVDLEIVFRRENKVAYGSQEIKKKIPLKAVVDSGNIESCFSDTENMIEEAARKACHGDTARWDETLKECHHEVSTTTCPAGQVMINMKGTAGPNGGPIVPECVDAITGPQTCAPGSYVTSVTSTGQVTCSPLATATANCGAGQYAVRLQNGNMTCEPFPPCPNGVLRANASGVLTCVDITCGSNQFFMGFDASGGKRCINIQSKDCGAGQYVTRVNADGSYDCDDIPPSAMGVAGPTQYIRGFNPDGSVVSNSFATCSPGQFLTFNGTTFTCQGVAAAACSPNCPNPAEICSGTTFNQPDGCGGTCNVAGTAKCSVHCGFVARGATACTNAKWAEKNWGGVAWETCQARCEFWMNKNNKGGGCWIKASNGVCYCRGGTLTLANNESFNSSDSGTCALLRSQY